MTIPFTKAHGAGNDFLLTWADQAPGNNLNEAAKAICGRHTGIGADGWILVRPDSIRLFNADGSEAELSGNGTRCAAALLVQDGVADTEVALMTGSGRRTLHLIKREDRQYLFEMDMGQPIYNPTEIRHVLDLNHGPQAATVLNVGNPQCAVFVDEFPDDWERIGAEIEAHRFFPRHTNVSFVRVVNENEIDVRFYERGVGPTLSSGTGSTGAGVAAILRKHVKSPIAINTLAGRLQLRWDDSVYLTGPAQIIASGIFYV